jgi:zinc protease
MTLHRFRVVALAVVLAAAGPAVSAQTVPAGQETTAASVAGYSLTQQMPVDPEAALGTLPNGLRYYVRANPRPANRAELRLVVKAGSALEDEDQRGLAHFVEHMEFEGTTHFPEHGITDFLTSLGLSIGPDANAATSFDDTQYSLRVPADVPGVIDRALLVLQDWAQSATFDQSGIDHERGIVLSEWRMRLGAGERTEDRVRRVELEGSRYADRKPIGDPTVIEQATREQLTRFYHDWYRPDLMAVIVVGDVDRDAVAAMIRERFSGLANPSPERPRPNFDVPDHAATRYTVITDRENTATAVEMLNLRPARNQGSVGGYRDIMMDQLFAGMFGSRLDELSQSANPPFLRANADRSLFPSPRTRDEAVLQALVANNGVERGLDALLTELARVQRFGFTQSELDREKQSMMLGYERAATESPDRESSSRADEYTRNFLEDEALPTIWQELAFHRRFLPGITLEEINALAGDWFPEQNRLVVVTAPEADGVALPSEAQLAAVVQGESGKRLEPWVDSAAGQKLMDAPPKPGQIVNATVQPESDITTWTLSNGATVVLKPTKLKEDQILFRATAPGGTSVAPDADFISARIADSVIPAGGAGRFNSVTLDKILARRPAVHRRDRGGHGRREHAAGPRGDVPAALPALHGAARRPDDVRRDGVAGEGAARQSQREPRRRLHADD